MAFVGVQFEDSSIGLISTEWLTPRKKETFWPQSKHRADYYKSLKSHELPSGSWGLHSITHSFFQIEDFDKALKKIKQAEETSDLQSDLDELRDTKKRHRKASRKLYELDSEDDEDTLLPRPPALKRTKALEIESDKRSNSQEKVIDTPKSDTPKTSFVYRPSSSNSFASSVSSNSLVDAGGDDSILKVIINVLFQLKEQNQQILNHITKSNAVSCALPEIPVELPLKTVADIELLENHLLIRKDLFALSDYLSTIGGKDGASLTTNILRRCLTNEVACSYSFRGKNTKKAFCDLALKTAIIGAAKKKFPGISEKEIEDCMKIWLKHSPQRFKADVAKGRFRQ